MKKRKQKAEEYDIKYNEIPRDFQERLYWMHDHLHVTDKKEQEILDKRDRMLNSLQFQEFFIVLYEEPEGTPRPRVRLVNRTNIANEAMANSSIRRKIAAINDSEVLEKYKAIEIKKLAQKAGIDIAVKEEKIVMPNDKEQIKLILGFLDEEAYKGPFSQITFLANSKRKVKNK